MTKLIIDTAQKALVESGVQGKDENNRPCKIPSLLSTLRRRFKCGRVDWYNMSQGVMFLLYDCNEAADNPAVGCLSKDQHIIKEPRPTGL